MKRFPTVKSLAEASIEEVVKLWEGLGYYSRARNLHAGARQVLERFGGEIPCNADDLADIKGLGPYTVGAILSFAFHRKAPAVDGNVQRVLARLFHLEDDFSKPAASKKVWGIADKILPDEDPWIVNEALIELGATVCTRKPQCSACPLRKSCLSFARGDAADIPFKSRKTAIEYLHRAVAVVISQGRLLVRKGAMGEVMAGLHEFPYFPCTPEGLSDEALVGQLGLKAKFVERLPSVSHGFTRYQATLYPYYFEAPTSPASPHGQWIAIPDLHGLAFSSGHKRILEYLLSSKLLNIL
jgi:A/G-specific adenine glycosylase